MQTLDSSAYSTKPTRRIYGKQPPTVIILLLLSLAITACSNATPSITPPTNEGQSTATVRPSETPIPTQTNTPLPPLAILLVPAQADAQLAGELQNTLEGAIAAAGMRWQVRQRLAPEDLVQELRLVIVLPPDPGVAELMASAPNTHFLALGITGLQPSRNLSVIGAQGVRPDQAGFMAGVIAAIITPDWRVGAISTSDTAGGVAARQGFVNGAIYFCGLCRPAYPPYYNYPVYVELPIGSTPSEWQNAADFLIEQYAKTVYIYPEAGDEALRSYLADKGVKLIGSEAQPAGLQASWVSSLRPNLLSAVSEALPTLLSSEGGIDLPAPLEISDINTELFSPGRQRLAEEILADLLAGYIGTGAGNP
jgi:hypothetical protein